jgi:exodeoxyribonuclease III
LISIATWNINSLRVRLEQLTVWLAEHRPDIVALQETKVQDHQFPNDAILALGYTPLYTGEKTYNGVAVLSRVPGKVVIKEIPGWDDSQRRLIGVRLGGLLLLNAYVPNGSSVGSEKYAYKLAWLRHLTDYVATLGAASEYRVILGDFNIAPEDRDVHDPQAWAGQVLVSEPERTALGRLLALGYVDVFRNFEQPAGTYSWWDYRAGSFRRNHGLRIDLVIADASLAQKCKACTVDVAPRRAKQSSDHAPVIAQFELDPGVLSRR